MSRLGDGSGICSRPFVGVRGAVKPLLIGLLATAGAALWHWRTVLDPIAITAAIAGGRAAPLWFLAAHTGASLLFVPRTLLAIVAGLLFGVGWGIVLAALGGVAGAVAGFLAARYISAGWVDLDRSARVGPILERVARGGWRAVAMLRLIPFVPHSLANYGLGLTPLPLGAYAFGSLVGQLPLTIAYVDLGAAGERFMTGSSQWIEPTVIGIAVLAVSLLLPRIARRPAP
jgi:uncharacterized membrane protein YdjX (TVP38/TMEM64 family)